MSPHTVLLCDTGHYSPYYSQPFTTLITWKILRPIVPRLLWKTNGLLFERVLVGAGGRASINVAPIQERPERVPTSCLDSVMHTDTNTEIFSQGGQYTKSFWSLAFVVCSKKKRKKSHWMALWTPPETRHAPRVPCTCLWSHLHRWGGKRGEGCKERRRDRDTGREKTARNGRLSPPYVNQTQADGTQ